MLKDNLRLFAIKGLDKKRRLKAMTYRNYSREMNKTAKLLSKEDKL